MKYLLLFCLLWTNLSFGQTTTTSNKGNLTLKYFKIEREQIGGSYETRLSNHFDYLKLFKKDQRFAPDEPSSISSLEFTFFEKKLKPKFAFELSAGIYRNHIKGDLLLSDGNEVHFGLGNSQVGISTTGIINYDFYKGLRLGYFLQLGAGFHYTRWQSQNAEFIPNEWGVRGAGTMVNTGLQLTTPKFWNRWSIYGYLLYNNTYSKYDDIIYAASRPTSNDGPFQDIHFTLKNKNIIAALGLSFDILINK